MVFSLFKKKTQKMPEREVMRPKPAFAPTPAVAEQPATQDEAVKVPEPLPDLEFTTDGASGEKPATGKSQPKTKEEMAFAMSEFEREYTESDVMAIDVNHGAESIQSDIEQVAVIYANGQDTDRSSVARVAAGRLSGDGRPAPVADAVRFPAIER